MAFSLSRRTGRLLLAGSLALMAVLSGGRLATSDPVPWEWAVSFAVGVFVLAGPVAWAVRDRVPEERRERLGYVATGLALLCFPFVLGLGLVFGNLLVLLDAGTFGGIVGFAVALLVERSVVPERLRGTTP